MSEFWWYPASESPKTARVYWAVYSNSEGHQVAGYIKWNGSRWLTDYSLIGWTDWYDGGECSGVDGGFCDMNYYNPQGVVVS